MKIARERYDLAERRLGRVRGKIFRDRTLGDDQTSLGAGRSAGRRDGTGQKPGVPIGACAGWQSTTQLRGRASGRRDARRGPPPDDHTPPPGPLLTRSRGPCAARTVGCRRRNRFAGSRVRRGEGEFCHSHSVTGGTPQQQPVCSPAPRQEGSNALCPSVIGLPISTPAARMHVARRHGPPLRAGEGAGGEVRTMTSPRASRLSSNLLGSESATCCPLRCGPC